MRACNASLQSWLAGRNGGWVADLFDIALANGTTYSWTSFDQNLKVGATTYSALGPLIDRSKWSIRNTPEVPEMEVRILTNGSDMPDGSNLKLAAHNGLFDGGVFTLSRMFMPTPGDTSLGALPIFQGNVGQVMVDALTITITVKGANYALEQYAPRNRFTLSCTNSLYGSTCAPNPGQPGGGPSRAANTFDGTCGPGSQPTIITFAGTPPGTPSQLTNGSITFTSGANAGVTRTIQSWTDNHMVLAYRLYEIPAEGDAFKVTYGCNHTRGAGGCEFFNNLQHYRGFPFVPPATYAI